MFRFVTVVESDYWEQDRVIRMEQPIESLDDTFKIVISRSSGELILIEIFFPLSAIASLFSM
mgnify:CR=1 FL=1